VALVLLKWHDRLATTPFYLCPLTVSTEKAKMKQVSSIVSTRFKPVLKSWRLSNCRENGMAPGRLNALKSAHEVVFTNGYQ
jgi:hypothetical protein